MSRESRGEIVAGQLRIIENLGVRTKSLGGRRPILVVELRWGSVMAALEKATEADKVL